MKPVEKQIVYGVLAEFDSPESLLAAAEEVCKAGYRQTDAFTSFPVHGIYEALGARPSRLSLAVLLGGIGGLLGGLGLQHWVSVTAYPHVISGKPLFSWPSFVPIIFECTILGAALTAFVGMLMLNKLPQPYHPVFEGKHFDRVSTDGFMLAIEAGDPIFDVKKTRSFLKTLNPKKVETVKAEENV